MLIPYHLPLNKSFRIAGIYGQSNLFALLLLSGVFVYLYLHLHDKSFATHHFRLFRYLPFFCIGLSFFLTGSRAGLLALLLTSLCLFWFFVRKRYLDDKPALRRAFLFLFVVLLLAYVIAIGLNSQFALHMTRSMVETGVSAEARFLFWAAALLIFVDHPWLGVGLDNFKFYLPKYANQAHELLGFVQYEAMGYARWVHNELLQLLCEGGLFVFLPILILFVIFLYQLFLGATARQNWSPLRIYSHLFLLPFIIQSMFSWPLRHPALLLLFFVFLGIVVSHYPSKEIALPVWFRWVFRGGALLGLVAVFFVGFQEVRMGYFAQNMKTDNVLENFAQFERFSSQPYSQYPVLIKVTPRYARIAIEDNNVLLADKVLPYVEKLTDIQGAHWQWYNLAMVYHALGRRGDAQNAVQKAIDLWPVGETYWAFLHYLNMLHASEVTGRPLEEFLPVPPGGEKGSHEEFNFFNDRTQINQ